MKEQNSLAEDLFQYILKDEWKAFQTGNQILRTIRKQYEKEEDLEEHLHLLQEEEWKLLTGKFPWILQLEEVDCSVNPGDLGWGLFCYLEEMTNISKKYHLGRLDRNTENIVQTLFKYLLLPGTVSAAAEELGTDTHEINRRMKNRLGVSANEFSMMLKIEYAAKLLKNTEEEIPVVAKKLGYPSEENFVRKFREQMGCKPEQYRKECIGSGI